MLKSMLGLKGNGDCSYIYYHDENNNSSFHEISNEGFEMLKKSITEYVESEGKINPEKLIINNGKIYYTNETVSYSIDEKSFFYFVKDGKEDYREAIEAINER